MHWGQKMAGEDPLRYAPSRIITHRTDPTTLRLRHCSDELGMAW